MKEPVTTVDERFGDSGAKATPWAAARQVLEEAQLSWLTTVRADGRPHASPVGGRARRVAAAYVVAQADHGPAPPEGQVGQNSQVTPAESDLESRV